MVNRKILYNTKYLQLKSVKSKNGNDWVYAHRPNVENVVVILPVISKKEILFLIEERPPLQAENVAQYSIGLPAGLVGDVRTGETTEEAIKAELLEEAGIEADYIKIKAKKVASSAGCVSETCTIAIAYTENYKIISKPTDDGGIIKERILVNIDNVYEWLNKKEKEGYALTAQTLAALFYLKNEGDIEW